MTVDLEELRKAAEPSCLFEIEAVETILATINQPWPEGFP